MECDTHHSHDNVTGDCCNTIDKYKQTNDWCWNEPVCVVAEPGKVQANLLTKIHSRSDAKTLCILQQKLKF